jgi:serine/threonine protein phosphatase 1
MLICAVGDVHGRLDLMEAMIARIERRAAKLSPHQTRIVFLGDYIDRGPASKGVLDLLAHLRGDPRFVLLCGNHESSFADFLAAPRAASLFARYGGQETAASYGVEADFRDDFLARDTRDRLLDCIPPAHLHLLDSLDLTATFGDFFFCHAGIRPQVALDQQQRTDLIWIRDEFLGYQGLHPKIVVHGHTPHSEPQVMANRVNVDTMACRSGILSGLAIFDDQKELLSVEAR